MGQRDDAELVAAALAGGSEAFNPIVTRYRGQVYSVALARTGSFDDAEDVAQQVFVEAFVSLHALSDPGRLAAWLRSAAVHPSVDVVRKRRDTVGLDEAASRLTSDLTPEIELERRQRREQVLDAIGRLSKAQRETTTLFYLGDYSVQEVADIQETPVGTIKRRLHDARNQLKTEMLKMVEDTLRAEAPSEDFSERIFQLLTRYHRDPSAWPRNWAEQREVDARWETDMGAHLRAFGADGIEGFARAMQHRQALTRRYALSCLASLYLDYPSSDDLKETVLRLIKEALKDPNKKVRTRAVFYLLNRLHLPEDYVRDEIVPLVLPLLRDPAAFVRDRAARWLGKRAAYVPLAVAAGALAAHPDTRGPHLARLTTLVIEAEGRDASSTG